MKFRNLYLIGTSHISPESIKEVESFINERKPEIVCVELDKSRYYALISNKKKLKRNIIKEVRHIGLKGFIFSILGHYIEARLGEYVGVKPGTEMLTAIRLAKKNKLTVGLIDQDISITLRRFSEEITWKEKLNLVVDIIKGSIFKKNELGIEKFDLNKVPAEKVIKKLLKVVKKRYPNFYKVMITERNKVMADRLHILMTQNPDNTILAVIGAGHEKDMLDMIKQKHADTKYETITF